MSESWQKTHRYKKAHNMLPGIVLIASNFWNLSTVYPDRQALVATSMNGSFNLNKQMRQMLSLSLFLITTRFKSLPKVTVCCCMSNSVAIGRIDEKISSGKIL